MTRTIIVCTSEYTIDSIDTARAALALGWTLSRASDAQLRWLIVGMPPESLLDIANAHGVAAIDHLNDPGLDTNAPDSLVATIAAYCQTHVPQLVIATQTTVMRTILSRVAARLDTGIVVNCVGASASGDTIEVVAATHGGDMRSIFRFTGPTPYFILLMPGATEAAAPARQAVAAAPEFNKLTPVQGIVERVRMIEAARPAGPRLEDAEVVVAGGRGLGSERNFELIGELAEVLGGMAGASRPAVDAGWMEATRQVGLTGHITKPRLYIAVGISGASQHMAGCSGANVIVAINRDKNAPIFRHARYGIVADFEQILPALIRVARETSSSSVPL